METTAADAGRRTPAGGADRTAAGGAAAGNDLRDHVVLCGLGTVGVCVAELLLSLGVRVAAVDRSPEPAAVAWAEKAGVLVVRGDSCSSVTLEQASVRTARAVVAVSGSDLANLQTALGAQVVNPRVRVVVRLFNEHIAVPLRRALGNAAVLSVAALAAPSLAAAALYGRGGAQCFPSSLDTPAARDMRATTGWWALLEVPPAQPSGNGRNAAVPDLPDEAVVVYAREPHGTTRLAPPLSDHDGAGSDSTCSVAGACAYGVLLPLSALQRWHVGPGRDGGTSPAGQGRVAQLRCVVRRLAGAAVAATTWPHAALSGTEPALRAAAAFLVALLVFSTLLFALFYDLAPDDALYFATTIITTVGFGDISLKHAPLPIKLYGTLLMLIGAASIAVVYAFVADYVVRARLSSLLHERPLPQHDHVIVCGLGTIGYRVATAVQEAGIPVAAVDRDDNGRFTREARHSGLPVLVGDASLPETLRRAGAAGACSALVCTSDDLANVQIALSVRECNPHLPVVVRLFDAHLAALAQHALGFHLARSPAALAAPAFAAAALGEAYRGVFTVSDHHLVVMEVAPPPDALGCAYTVWPGSGVAALAIHQSATVAGTHEGQAALPPKRDDAVPHHRWAAGDRLLAVCTLARAQALLQPVNSPEPV